MTTKPTIELRKIKHSKSLSEETAAYTAQIWFDGALFCDVSNHGKGGSDMHYPPKGMTGKAFYPLLETLNARIKETFPKTDVSDMYGKPPGTEMFDADLESICGQLLADAEFATMLKRDLARKILFVKGRSIFQVKKVPGREADLIKMLRGRHGADLRILNTMPFGEALAVYTTAE